MPDPQAWLDGIEFDTAPPRKDDGPAIPLGPIEDAPGPLVGRVVVPATADTPATMEYSPCTILRLATSNEPSDDEPPPGVLDVAPLTALGAPPLAGSLAELNLSGVFAALSTGVAVLPVLLDEDGSALTRVFGARTAGAKPYDLCLFSSAATLGAFLADDAERCFVIQPAPALIQHTVDHMDVLDALVFDPAGPTPLRIPTRTLKRLLDDHAQPTEPSEPEETETTETTAQPARVTGFTLDLDPQWGAVDLTDRTSMARQIERLVVRQTRNLGDQGAGLRLQMREWLAGAGAQAAEHGGLQLAFLLARTDKAAAALSVVTYLHAFGDEAEGLAHLDQIAESLAKRAGPDDAFVRIDLGEHQMLRHSRIKSGPDALGAAAVPLLLIDYWIPAPDHDHVAHVAFSTPHVDAADAMTTLADNVVLNGRWT